MPSLRCLSRQCYILFRGIMARAVKPSRKLSRRRRPKRSLSLSRTTSRQSIKSSGATSPSRRSALLCSLCRGITAEALASENGYSHAPLPEDLEGRGEEPCDLCRLLGENYYPRGYPEKQRGPLPHAISCGPLSAEELQRYSTSRWNLRLRLSPHRPGVFLNLTWEILPLESGEKEWSEEDATYWFFTPIGDPAANYGIPTIDRDLSDTKSSKTFNFIQSCLEKCNLEHDCTSTTGARRIPSLREQSISSPVAAPTRLVYLGDPDQGLICLVETSDQQNLKYMTLSHRWGANLPESCLTSKDNYAQRLKSFPVSMLPRTFRDAIDITRRLCVNFLWIDALCILQDSEDDWAMESVQMGAIYQNSFLTIAASHAKDSSGGCYNLHSISQDRAQLFDIEDPTIEITGIDSSGARTTLILFTPPFDSVMGERPHHLTHSPLHNRGWIFQERMLSPRTVHFTSSQVIWGCRKEYWFEDLIPLRDAGLRLSLPQVTTLDEWRSPAEQWYRGIIEGQYNDCVLTKPSDRLVALAGVAKTFQTLIKDRYVAGLWESSLAYGLSWESNGTQATNHRWPTWSWASHDGKKYFPGQHSVYIQEASIELVDIQLEFAAGYVDEFSPVIGGFLTVSGCLIELDYQDFTTCFYFECFDVYAKFDDDSKISPGQRVTALVVGKIDERDDDSPKLCEQFLFLERYNIAESAYTRIGVGGVNYFDYSNIRRFSLDKDAIRAKVAEAKASRTPEILYLY